MGKAPGQPGATNMLEMVWDDNLATLAQNWANVCSFSHDSNSDLTSSTYGDLGQNLVLTESSKKLSTISFTGLVQEWYDEVKLYNGVSAPVNSYVFDSGTGHYTQLVWGNSYAVGCGFMVYSDSGMYAYQLTCNYGPAGNYDGEKIYTQGTFNAGNCKNGASTTYQGLCKH